jgi:hypothetical protein
VLDCKEEDIGQYILQYQKHFSQSTRQLALDGRTSLCTEIAMDEGLRHELLHELLEHCIFSAQPSTDTTLD